MDGGGGRDARVIQWGAEAAAILVESNGTPTLVDLNGKAEEIGRASCRERV